MQSHTIITASADAGRTVAINDELVELGAVSSQQLMKTFQSGCFVAHVQPTQTPRLQKPLYLLSQHNNDKTNHASN